MKVYIPRRFSTVVMDDTDEDTTRFIVSTIDFITKKRHGQAYLRALSKDHLTKAVIDVVTTEDVYTQIQETLEGYFPGLCIFNPPMKV